MFGQSREEEQQVMLRVCWAGGHHPPPSSAAAWGILAGLIRSYFPYFPPPGSLTIVNVRVD